MSSGFSLNTFQDSKAAVEKKVRMLMFSRVREKDGNFCLILFSTAPGNIKMPSLFIAGSSGVFRNIFTSLGIYYVFLARAIIGRTTMALSGENRSSKQAGNNYDGIHFYLRVDLYSVAG